MADQSQPTTMPAARKRLMAAAGAKFGCCVDGEWSDDCVLDYGAHGDCKYAVHRRKRETCQWWQPMPEDQNEQS